MCDEGAVLIIEGLVKEFQAGARGPTLYQVVRAALDGRGASARRRVLDGISIEVRTGETIGIVGDNGAGKTTLLKTIAGLYQPTRGRLEIRGERTLLAGLGAGMVGDLSVRDNIYLYGAVCGVRRRTLTERFADILRWAELEGFAGAELRTLSTGMRTRLAFAITMHIESELVLMDEAFSAGDARFQERCDRALDEWRTSRRTLLVATHKLDFVRAFCDRTLWLEKGRQRAFGPSHVVLPQYVESGKPASGQGDGGRRRSEPMP